MDLVKLPSPTERYGVYVGFIDPFRNVISQLLLRIDTKTAQALACHLTEESLDEIEPRGSVLVFVSSAGLRLSLLAR